MRILERSTESILGVIFVELSHITRAAISCLSRFVNIVTRCTLTCKFSISERK